MRREIIAKRLMQNAEQHLTLDKDQHRDRNSRCEMDIVLGKIFMLETFHLQRSNIGFTDCDAKACYNRIVLLILLLAYYKKGLLYEACVFFARILYNMEHTTTTAYGPSTRVNYDELIAAVFGISQRSTDGPSRWTCISNPILKTYHRRCSGCSIHNPTNSIKIQANADMFVNNNTLAHNNTNKEADLEELMFQIQNDTKTWGRLLESTGGQQEYSKSSYSLMNWAFHNNGKPHLTTE